MKLWDEQFFSKRLLVKYLWIMVLMCFMMKFTQGIAFVLAVPVALASLARRKPLLTFFVVLLAISSIITNGWFVPKGLVYTVTQRGLMAGLGFMMVFQIFGQRQSPFLKPLLGMYVYLVYMFFVSFNGYSPTISMLKLFLFATTFMTYYVAVTSLINSRSLNVRQLRSMVLALGVFFILGSFAVWPFPAISVMNMSELRNSVSVVSLFKGMTSHSQELGPMVSALGLFLLGDYLFSIQRKNGLYAVLLLGVPVLVYMTSSRTAMGGLLSGVMFMGFCVMISRGLKRSWKNSVMSAGMMILVLALAGAVAVPTVREKVAKFVVKYEEKGKIESADQIFASRQHKWDDALYGWRRSPYLGNGFQVTADMMWFKARSFKDLLSAPIEKSTWIFAVLEEGGIVGMIIFCTFLLVTFAILLARRAYIGATMLFNLTVMNLGEFTFFSMSGGGGFMWALLFAGLAMDAVRHRGMQEQKRMPSVGFVPMGGMPMMPPGRFLPQPDMPPQGGMLPPPGWRRGR